MLCVVAPLVVVVVVVGGGSGALTECVIGSPRDMGAETWARARGRPGVPGSGASVRPRAAVVPGRSVSSVSGWLRARRGHTTRTPVCHLLKRKIAFRDRCRCVSAEV